VSGHNGTGVAVTVAVCVGVGIIVSVGGMVVGVEIGAAVGFGEQPESTSPMVITISRKVLNAFPLVFMVILVDSLANYYFGYSLKAMSS
jgi:ABC-type microcin C transport system permease subunit YejE